MQQHMRYRIRGLYRIARMRHRWAAMTYDAGQRLEALSFARRHGMAAAGDAWKMSQRTLYRWRRMLREAGNNPSALELHSTAPRRRQLPCYLPG